MSNYSSTSNPENKRKKQIFYIILIILLILVNGFLFYSNIQSKSENKALTEERNDLLEQKAVFERKVDSLKNNLEEAKGLNVELDSIIQTKIKELDQMKINYSRRIADKEVEIAQLNKEIKQKIKEVDRLRTKYNEDIAEWEAKYSNLEEEKNTLEDTLANRESKINDLSQKINKGEILSAAGIDAYGIKYRFDNKEVKNDKAKKVDKLVVCFKLANNRLADAGVKNILVRIVNPEGTTMAVQEQGSGTFQLAESGNESLYTKQVTIDYDPEALGEEHCMEWSQEADFQPGEYKVELYQHGYLIGQSSLKLEDSWLF